MKSGLTTEQVVIKLKLPKPPLTGLGKYSYLQKIWKQEQKSSSNDFLWWYNNKDVVPILEAMQKMIAFYHDKDIDMMNFARTLTIFANTYLHKCADAYFHPFTEGDRDLLEKFEKTLLVIHLSFLHANLELLSESLQTYANLLLGFIDSELCPYSICQPMPTGH